MKIQNFASRNQSVMVQDGGNSDPGTERRGMTALHVRRWQGVGDCLGIAAGEEVLDIPWNGSDGRDVV